MKKLALITLLITSCSSNNQQEYIYTVEQHYINGDVDTMRWKLYRQPQVREYSHGTIAMYLDKGWKLGIVRIKILRVDTVKQEQ